MVLGVSEESQGVKFVPTLGGDDEDGDKRKRARKKMNFYFLFFLR